MVTLDQLSQDIHNLKQDFEAAIANSKINPRQIATIGGLSDIDVNLGVVRAGEFLALSRGTDPLRNDSIGTFISALGKLFGEKTYHIGGVNLGDLKWGVNSETGELEAGDGTIIITENGISVYNDSPAEIARFGNLNGFLDYISDVYGIAIGNMNHYMTYDYDNGVRVYGALVSNRKPLTEDTTYYVRTYGSDDNDGIDGSPEHAFLTLQGAINKIADSVDTRNYDIYIHLGEGTYEITSQVELKNLVGGGSVFIYGDTETPSNVILSSSDSGITSSKSSTPFYISGLRLERTGTPGGYAISAFDNAILSVGNVEFGPSWEAHIHAEDGGEITLTDSYEIDGTSTTHMEAIGQGRIISSAAVTLTDTPVFTTFAVTEKLGYIKAAGTTYINTATGIKYSAATNSVIDTGSGGANFFPGDVAGGTATGGLYI